MDIYQHFNKDEYSFVDKTLEQTIRVSENYSPKLLNFLTPREQEIVVSLVRRDGNVKVAFSGGLEGAERKRAVIFPDYYDVGDADFQLTAFRLTYMDKFISVKHQQVLGRLMSLGVERKKYGDIYLHEGQIDIVVAAEIAAYIAQQLNHIHCVKMRITEIKIEQLERPLEEWLEESITVQSLRLDTVVAALTNQSRQKAQLSITQGKVQLNWRVMENQSIEIKPGDLLSIRGLGRIKLIAINGQTKKGKWHMTIGKQK